MTEVLMQKDDQPIDPNTAANANKDKAVSGRPLKAATIPDSQARGDQFGHVPPKDARGKGTGTIPAVDDTTLTQVPHAASFDKRVANPNREPFGREMNHPGATPGQHFVRDPQVYPTDPTVHSYESEGSPGLTKASVSGAQERKA